ncbi:Mor transcription activator family protein [Variovorax paradoxus B4]|uniref:Mor transcription activator family protein n=1 Tax=Variovorax paradoxus B4 TaxID=1246301 RepID=T1XG56_VARPD|nr:Mor transcription activator family protein [Variovorax paradoxus]AGU51538.1 Mor transcription activator family protein [Variovorax paradoxus B4]
MTAPIPNDEPLAIIEEEARAMARCFGVAVPEDAAASLIERILLRLGGAHIYLPRRTSRKRQQAHREIVCKFNGSNLMALAKEYGMTPRHVRRIISDGAQKQPLGKADVP